MGDLLALVAPSLAPLGALGAVVAILVWLIRAVGDGRLIPASTHDTIMDQRDREVERLTAALERAQSQADKLSDTGETTLQLLRSLSEETQP